MTWWDTFFWQVVGPTWAAGLLQATVATVLAFVGAYALVRRQLLHDRENFAAQLAHDRTLALAQHNRGVVAGLADILVALKPDIEEIPRAELARILLSGTKEPPGFKTANRAVRQAHFVVQGVDDPADGILRDGRLMWQICRDETQVAWGRARKKGVEERVFLFCAGAAVHAVLEDTCLWLLMIGQALAHWGGMSPLPGREVVVRPEIVLQMPKGSIALPSKAWASAPGTGHPEYLAWRENVISDYRGYLRSMLKVFGSGKVKLPGDPGSDAPPRY